MLEALNKKRNATQATAYCTVVSSNQDGRKRESVKKCWEVNDHLPDFCGGVLTLFESQPCWCIRLGREALGSWGVHTKPSNKPSPVVAQLGTTYQILSFS